MKDSGVEWIGEIPEGWERRKLNGLLQNIGSGTTPKSNSKYYDGEYPWLNTGDLTDDLILDVSKTVTKLALQDHSALKIYDAPSVVIALYGATIGKLGITTYPLAVNQACCVMRTAHNLDYRFLFYVLLGIRRYLLSLSYGSGQPNISAETIKSLHIPHPTHSEQQEVASFLDSKCSLIETTIEKEREVIDKLKEYRQAVITESVTKGIRAGVPMKDSGVEWIGEIPEGWSVFRVKYLLNECEERSLDGNEEPLSMSQKYGIIKSYALNIPNPASSYVGGKLVFEEDLVFNKLKAHLGVFSLSKYRGVVSPDYAVYHGINDTNAKFLEYLFKTGKCICEFKKYIRGVGAGLSRLYTSDLFNIKVAIPLSDEQQLIVQFLNSKCSAIDATIQIRELAIEKLTAYKQSLIYECVTGKREVVG